MATLTPDILTGAYMAQVTSVRDRVLAYAELMWEGSDSLRDADVERLVSRIVPVVHGGQVQVANITNAYITRLAVMEGVIAEAAQVDTETVIDYRGVPVNEVYRRPAVTTYVALSEGKPFDAAKAAGLSRLKSIVSTDIQQSRNSQARAAYSSSGFTYTERFLSGAENCALCVIASTQRYLAKDLQPIHPGCDCGQRGVKSNRDPGQIIKPELLELTHTEINARLSRGDRGARDLGLGKTDSRGRPISDFTDLIVTRQHGELGPTLAWRDEKFTSAQDIAALN